MLIPIMFVGGYTQKVLRQLSIMINSTIFASLMIALTVVPLIASKVIKKGEIKKTIVEKWVSKFDIVVKAITKFYVNLLKIAMRFKVLTLLIIFGAFFITLKVVPPLVMGELMPPMDTGIASIKIDMPSSYNIKKVEQILYKVEDMIKKTPGYVLMSSVVGSEPGQISFGGGGETLQTARITVNLVTRDKRKQTIWQIEDKWRKELSKIDGIRSFAVMEFGATPLSTTKAPFDLILRSKNRIFLDIMADEVMEKLKNVKGLIDIRRSWYMDKPEVSIVPDEKLCKYYGVDTEKVAKYIKFVAKGDFSSFMRLEDFIDIPIRVEYKEENKDEISKLKNVYVPTKYGQIPLRNLVKINKRNIQPFITREDLQNTIDITGVNSVYTIAQVAKEAAGIMKRNKSIVPKGFNVRMSGTPEDMIEAKTRMKKALIYGLILMYILLMASYKSFSIPIVIMVTIPLAVIGALWGLLIFDKPMCMPATMGLILLAGVIIKNAVLLVDFILAAREKGLSREDAIIQSVEIRTRPILMTAITTIVGLIPLMFSMAVGLERLAPLGIVAGIGLILGTFLTIIVIPIFYVIVDDLNTKVFSKNKAKTFFIFLAFSSLFFSKNSFAVDNQKKIFDLKTSIEYALKNSPDIKISSASVKTAKGHKIQFHSLLLPKLNFSSSFTHFQEKHAIVPALIGTEQRFDNNVFSGIVGMSYLLTDFGKSKYSFMAAKENYLSSINTLERKKEMVIYTVGNLYFNIVSIDKLIEALQILHRSISELQRRIALFLEKGKVAKIDLLKVNVRLAEINDEISKLESKRTFLIALFAQEIGYNGEFEIGKNINKLKVNENEINFDKIFEKALENREDIERVKHILNSTEFKLKAAKRNYFPSISFLTGFGEYTGTSSSSKFSGSKRWEDDYFLGLTFSLPVFDGYYRKGKIIEAEGMYEKAVAEKRKIILSIKKDVQKAISDFYSAKMRLSLADASMKEAEETLRLEKLKYIKGKGVINDLLDAEASLRKADFLYYSAICDYNTNIFQIYLSDGMLYEKYNIAKLAEVILEK